MTSIKHSKLNITEIEEFFSLEYIEMFSKEMAEIDLETGEGVKKFESMCTNLSMQLKLNADRLGILDKDLSAAKLKIKILEAENDKLNQLLSSSDECVEEQCEKVESAKETVKESLKFASVFAEENEYETYRGNEYLRLKTRYLEEIFPLYNNALKKANQYLDKVKHAELIDQLISILQEVLNDINMLAFWRNQVTLTQRFIDASSVNVDGKFYPVPRGIFLARQELEKLNQNPHLDKLEIVKQACLEMQKRLGNEKKNENKKKKATTEFYTAVCDCLVGNNLVVTEDKLFYLRALLKDAIFNSLQLPHLSNRQDRCMI